MNLKHISFITLVAIVLSSLSSCLKKGEDDPLISLRTRKARVVGKWKIESGSEKLTNVYYNSATEIGTVTTTYSENTFTEKIERQNSTEITTGSFTYEIEFKKNGEFASTATYNNIFSTVLKGTWNFTGNIEEHKNKDQIVINFSSKSYLSTGSATGYNETFSYLGNKSDETYYIKELKNKKIVLESEYSYAYNSGIPSSFNTDLTLIQ